MSLRLKTPPLAVLAAVCLSLPATTAGLPASAQAPAAAAARSDGLNLNPPHRIS